MGKKKDAALHGMSKKARRKLEEREAALAAELKRRKKKAEKKKGKKSKDPIRDLADATRDRLVKEAKPGKKSKGKKAKKGVDFGVLLDAGALGTMTISAEAPIVGEIVATMDGGEATVVEGPRDEIIGADGKTKPEVIEKRKKKAAAETAKLDAEIKARLAEKRAEREKGAKPSPAVHPDARDGESEAEFQYRRKAEKEAARQTVEEVETERGRVFEAGKGATAIDVDGEKSGAITFAKPSDAAPELEENRLGYKIIQLDADGKPDPKKKKALARVTTFVGNIDDETTLKKWDKRMVIEGLAADLTVPEAHDPLVVQVSTITHRRDVKIAKAIKKDRKGDLGIGEVGELIRAAEKEAKDALDKIADEAAEIAGRHKKAKAGSHLHRLAEISDAEGIDAVRQIHEAGLFVPDPETGDELPITDTDMASIEAYAEAMTRLGAKVLHSEAIIVNDAMRYAGRLDRIVTAKLPELVIGGVTRPADQRARRYVTDIKSGRIDLGAGKISRQLSAYALGDLYDPETGERSRHSASRDVALVFHLPQGDGVCTVHVVDLKAGTALLKLSAEVRRARNTGKKTIDTKTNLIDLLPEIEA